MRKTVKGLKKILAGVMAALMVVTSITMPDSFAAENETTASVTTHSIVAAELASVDKIDGFFKVNGGLELSDHTSDSEESHPIANLQYASKESNISFTTEGTSALTIKVSGNNESELSFALKNSAHEFVKAASTDYIDGLFEDTYGDDTVYHANAEVVTTYNYENLTAGEYSLVWLDGKDLCLYSLDVTSTVEKTEDKEVVETPEETPSEGETSNVHTLEATSLTAFAAGVKADGDEEKAGTDNFFTIIYSVKSKVDSSSKNFEDGYSSSQRINFGGTVSTKKNSVKFTTDYSAKVKVWWALGDATRQMAILDASGTQIAATDVSLAKNDPCVSEFTLDNPGTYYLGAIVNNNYIFKIEVTEDVPQVSVNDYDLEATSLTAFAAGTKADGDEEKAGTDNFFTIIYSAKSKVDSSSKTFEDGYASSQRINFGGTASTKKNAVKFTTEGSAKVKVWWALGDVTRQIAILDASGAQVAATDVSLSKNDPCVSEFTLDNPGTYYLGSIVNNNYIFRICVEDTVGEVVKPARADWSTVEAPVILGAVQNAGNINVTVNANVGYDGADKVTVTMTDEDGKTTSKSSSAEKSAHTLTFAPDRSGTYTFVAEVIREGEENKASETVAADYILPLATPVIKTVSNAGKGSILVEWNAVKEATAYTVSVKSVDTDEILATETTEETTATISGLKTGETVIVTIVALRGEEESGKVTSEKIEVSANAERVWGTSRYGSSVNTANNGAIGSGKDGKVTVYSESGKGKIVPGSTDGLTFHYAKMDPETENFTIRAKVHVDNWTLSNGQEGFGLMVADTVGVDGDGTAFWNNSLQLLASKIEYYYNGEEVTTDTSAAKISMKLGLGWISKLGVTKEAVSSIKAGAITMPEEFVSESSTLETSAASLGTGTYNVVGNYKGVEPTGNLDNLLTDFNLEIQRNNTGYTLRYLDENGEVLAEKLFYDLDRNELTKIEEDAIYVGFFASRNARITVSDIELTTIDPSDDAPAEGREIEYIIPQYKVESATTSNSEDYTLTFYGNADGTLSITDSNGNVIAENEKVTANTKHYFATKLAEGDTTFTLTMTPDADFVPGAYKELTSYEAVTFTHTVNYQKIARTNIYVAPNGTEDAKGTKENPLDIYTAVKYASAGQKIVLAGGVYNLARTIKVERGIDGTADNMIYMIADPEATERPVFDFGGNCAGMVLAGNYWYFKGFDVTKSQDAQKGLQLSGSNCVIDQVNAYMNGNTGIQISRYLGTDEFAEWPANNLVLNCTSYLNADKGYEDADGFAAKLTVGEGNVFDGCISAYNADDGWDLFAKVQTGSIGAVTIKNSIAFRNGYVLKDKETGELSLAGELVNAGNGNGFKMGGDSMPGHHVLVNSVAFENKAKGFDSNSCPDIEVYNSIAFNNESYNVAFYTNTAVNTAFKAEGIVSFKNANTVAEQFKPKGTQDETLYKNATNFFFDGAKSSNTEGVTVSEDWFVSLDTSNALSLISSRNEDGTISMNGLLELSETGAANVKAGLESTPSNDVEVVEPAPEEPEKPSVEEKIQEAIKETVKVVTEVAVTVVKTTEEIIKTVTNPKTTVVEKVAEVTKSVVSAVKSIFKLGRK